MIMMQTVQEGDTVLVKVGKHEIKAKVIEKRPGFCKVQNLRTDKQLVVKSIVAILDTETSILAAETVEANEQTEAIGQAELAEQAEQPAENTEPAEPAEDDAPADEEAEEEADNAEEPKAEEQAQEKPDRKLSLLEAAIEVLKLEHRPMNTREMVKLATEKGLWTPTGCKTPEQTLYGGLFLEIKNSKTPRIKKSAERGKFELNA